MTTFPQIYIRHVDGLTRASLLEYSIDDMAVVNGPATHCMLTWTGSVWQAELTWRGEPPPAVPPMHSPDPDAGEILRRIYVQVTAPEPTPDPSPYPSSGRWISSTRFQQALHAILQDCRVKWYHTAILGRLDDPSTN